MANVTEAELRRYLEAFLSTLRETADRFLDPRFHSDLLHLSVLPAVVKGYVSTKYGVAVEYDPAPTTEVRTARGSSSIEDVVFNAPPEVRQQQPMLKISDCRNVTIFNLTFQGRLPFRLSGNETTVSVGRLHVVGRRWERSIAHAEFYGTRDQEYWSLEKAVSRAKDEVLAAVVDVGRAQARSLSIADYISLVKEKTVLVLGSYAEEGEQRLNAIVGALRRLGFDPLLIRDVPDSPYQDLSQKLVAVGALARFIVIDDSSPSGHLVEFEICRTNRWVTVILRKQGKQSSWMTAGAAAASSVIRELEYEPASLEGAVREGAQWAQERLDSVEVSFAKLYPWRMRVPD